MEMGVFPRAKLLIKDENSPVLEYKNVSLLDKSSIAVAKAIKLYPTQLDKVVFNNNGIL